MLPQTELDNYKLQVELLQEKLRRSEEQRQHLEEKFEKLIKKQDEEENVMKRRKKIKYQQFLEALEERNERNKALLKMLEMVDQKALQLATKTERLKMMKLQYELYFAKLLQNQVTQPIHGTAKYYTILPAPPHILQSSVTTTPTIPPLTTSTTTNDIIHQTTTKDLEENSILSPLTNWSVMANSLSNTNIEKKDYISGSIPLNQEFLQYQSMRQPIKQIINSKSNIIKDSDTSLQHHSIIHPSTEIDTIENIESNQSDFKYNFKTQSKFDILPQSNSVNIQSTSLQQNERKSPTQNEIKLKHQINEIQNIHEIKDIKDDLQNNKYSKSLPLDNFQYQSSSYHNQQEQQQHQQKFNANENFSRKINENYNKNNINENTPEKSQPINIVKDNFENDIQLDYSRQKINENFERNTTLTSATSHEKIFEDKKQIFDSPTSQQQQQKHNVTQPAMWNFGGRIDTTNIPSSLSTPSSSGSIVGSGGIGTVSASTIAAAPSLPIKLGKKEKLSIENIENVIYGEKINPIESGKFDFIKENKKRTFSNESILDNDDLHDKEISFKFDNYQKQNDKNKENVNDKMQVDDNLLILDSNKSESLNSEPKVIYMQPQESPLQIQGTQDNNDKEELDENLEKNLNKEEITEYNQNYEQNSYNFAEDQHENYESTQENLENQAITTDSTSASNQDVQQNGEYLNQQYQNPDYQYQSENEYPNQDYQTQDQNYQNEEYQYDPNTYQYDYSQEGDQYASQYDDMQYGTDQQQYPIDNNQYPAETQHANDNQYITDNQYASDGGIYQDSNQQEYTGDGYTEQNYNDKAYQQIQDGEEYQSNEQDGTINLQNNEEYSQKIDPQSQIPASDSTEISSNEISQPVEEFITPSNDDNSIQSESTNEGTPQKNKVSSPQATASTPIKPTSILATTEKSNEQQNVPKKKKKVNFLDSETEDSSSAQKVTPAADTTTNLKSDESDFDFSSK